VTDSRTDPVSAGLDRRRFLALGAAGLVCAAGLPARAATGAREIAFENLHTGETLRATYWENGAYVDGALGEIDRILRDFRTGEVAPIDPALIDLLVALRGTVESDKAFGVISGYRSPRTNAMLRSTGGGGVARRSLHTVGMAIDIRLPGVRLKDLRTAALSLKRGGVGYYPKSNFVHVDTGRVRFW
jgi:uncharacterized protein YcbK (DUF882 family)